MSARFRPFPGTPPLPRGKRLVVIVWLFAGIVACLLVAAVLSLGLLSAGRAFVEGAAYWTRAQKEAGFHLPRSHRPHHQAGYDPVNRPIARTPGGRRGP